MRISISATSDQPSRHSKSSIPFLMLHSQKRNTVQPRFLNSAVTSLSLSMLRARFLSQYAAFCLGTIFLQWCPCQKQPSAKTAIFLSGNTKSGLPITGYFRRQPLIPLCLNISISLCSVERFPFAFTFRIIALLSSFENVSAISYKRFDGSSIIKDLSVSTSSTRLL